MSDPARPICPHCGAPLFARTHGDMTCVQHGTLVGHDLLDRLFGAGASSRVAAQAAYAVQAPRKCPLDRYATSHVRTPAGYEADGCGRCGSLWVPWTTVEAVMRASPAPGAPTLNEQRSLVALGVARALASVQPPPQRRR